MPMTNGYASEKPTHSQPHGKKTSKSTKKKLFLIKIQCSKLSSYTQSINQKRFFLQHHRLQANNKLTNRGPRSYAPCVKKLGNKNEL